MLSHQLEPMNVKQIREYIKEANLDIKDASKKRKNVLVIEILVLQDKLRREAQAMAQQMQYLESEELFQMEVEQEIVALQKEEAKKNSKSISVVLEDNTELSFDSNKAFAEYFNAKHNTSFRNDIAWYLKKGKNKKARQTFQIKEID